MHLRILSKWLASGVCLCFWATLAYSSTPDSTFSQIDSIVKTLSEITGLSENNPVNYGRMSKRQLRAFLSKRMKKSLRPDEIKADELALKMFGFVPQEFDLRKSTVNLLTEQAAAFYDYSEKRLFLMEDSNIASERMTLAHELSHALADQHFNLEKFMDDKPTSDDENLAHSAVVEGQASWLMIAYNLKEAGHDATPTPEILRSITDSDSASTSDYPVLSDAPAYIRQSLIFPYAQGTAFFQATFNHFGQRAFSEVFLNPPVGSSQILHPDRYFAGQLPIHPPLPELPGVNDKDEITSGSVSEFDHQMLVSQYVDEAHALAIAPRLAGGQFEIDRHGRDHRPVLRYTSQWDSDGSASSFFALYPKILNGKWKHCDVVVNTPTMLAGTGDRGYFIARLQGSLVSSIEGLSDAAEWQALRGVRIAESTKAPLPAAVRAKLP